MVKTKITLHWQLINCFWYILDFFAVCRRGFTRMVHQFLSNKRIPLPACACMAIRKTFPVTEKEAFTGYVDESD